MEEVNQQTLHLAVGGCDEIVLALGHGAAGLRPLAPGAGPRERCGLDGDVQLFHAFRVLHSRGFVVRTGGIGRQDRVGGRTYRRQEAEGRLGPREQQDWVPATFLES